MHSVKTGEGEKEFRVDVLYSQYGAQRITLVRLYSAEHRMDAMPVSIGVGAAICTPEDNFDRVAGRSLALRKAMTHARLSRADRQRIYQELEQRYKWRFKTTDTTRRAMEKVNAKLSESLA